MVHLDKWKPIAISSELLQAARPFFGISQVIGATPFLVNPSTRRFFVNQSSKYKIIHSGNWLLYILIHVLCLYLTHIAITISNRRIPISPSLIVTMICLCMMQIVNIATTLTFDLFSLEMVTEKNQLVFLIDRILKTFNKSSHTKLEDTFAKHASKIFQLAWIALASWLFFTFFVAPIPYLKDIWRVYYYAIQKPIEDYNGQKTPMLGTFALITFVLVPIYWHTVLSCTINCLLGTFLSTAIATEAYLILNYIRISKNDRTNLLEETKKSVESYLCLSLIINSTVDHVRHIVIPIVLSMGLSICSITLYFTIGSKGNIFERVLSAGAWLILSVGVSFAIYWCGCIWRHSSQVLEEYIRAYVDIFVKECGQISNDDRAWGLRLGVIQPMKVRVGSTYYLKLISVPEFCLNVLDKTVFLLSGFPMKH